MKNGASVRLLSPNPLPDKIAGFEHISIVWTLLKDDKVLQQAESCHTIFVLWDDPQDTFDMKTFKACEDYAAGKFESGSGDEALKYIEKACEMKLGSSCHFIGVLYQYGSWVPANAARARYYYDKGCEAKEEGSCASLANLYEKGKGGPADLAKAKAYYGKACDMGHEKSCSNGDLSK